jgi:hypothetical protein
MAALLGVRTLIGERREQADPPGQPRPADRPRRDHTYRAAASCLAGSADMMLLTGSTPIAWIITLVFGSTLGHRR